MPGDQTPDCEPLPDWPFRFQVCGPSVELELPTGAFSDPLDSLPSLVGPALPGQCPLRRTPCSSCLSPILFTLHPPLLASLSGAGLPSLSCIPSGSLRLPSHTYAEPRPALADSMGQHLPGSETTVGKGGRLVLAGPQSCQPSSWAPVTLQPVLCTPTG